MSPEDEWNRGVSLWNAMRTYGDPSYWQKYAARQHPLQSLMEAFPALLEGDKETSLKLSEEEEKIARLREVLEWEVTFKIQQKELVSLGYVDPRTVAAKPVRIPLDVWHGPHTTDFNNNKVEGNGLKFLLVRVVPSTIAQLETPEKKKSGRKPLQAEIFDTYRALGDSGFINYGASMRVHYDLMRRKLCDDHPDRAGTFETVSNETIRKVIREDFQAKKKQ